MVSTIVQMAADLLLGGINIALFPTFSAFNCGAFKMSGIAAVAEWAIR